jgi:hypothetical protein
VSFKIGDMVTINGKAEKIGLCRKLAGVVWCPGDDGDVAYLVRLSDGQVVRTLWPTEDFDQAVLAYEREQGGGA